MGRPAFKPTDQQRLDAEELAGLGLPLLMIARLVGCDKDVLRKYLDTELRQGEAKATANIARTLYGKAIAGDTACLIFWLKCRANWSERAERNLGVIDGDPEVEVLSTAELERRVAAGLRNRAAAKEEGATEPDRVH